MKETSYDELNKQPRRSQGKGPAIEGSHKSFRDMTAQEAHDQVKEAVSKVIATAAGAIEGVADTMKENHVPEKAREAVETIGETGREVGKASKDAVKTLGDTGREIGKASKEEFQRTKSEIGGGSGTADHEGSSYLSSEPAKGLGSSSSADEDSSLMGGRSMGQSRGPSSSTARDKDAT